MDPLPAMPSNPDASRVIDLNSADPLDELLEHEAIETTVHDILEVIAHREEAEDGNSGAIAAMHRLFGSTFDWLLLPDFDRNQSVDELKALRAERRQVLRARLVRVATGKDQRSLNLSKWILAEATQIKVITNAINGIPAIPLAADI